jgi:sirohydrochlorin ferrochelatase
MTLLESARRAAAWWAGTDAPLVLVAHGSQDPRSPRTMHALAAAVGTRWAAPVSLAFLDFNPPTVPEALAGLAAPIVLPLLLTTAYHGKVDLPGVLRSVPVGVRAAGALGPSSPGDAPHPLLLKALSARLTEVDEAFDGLVLIAAGTSDEAARSTVDSVGAELGRGCGVPCVTGYASGGGRSAADAVNLLRGKGCRRIVASSYFLAPGRLHDVAVASAASAGVGIVSAPLGPQAALADLVVARAAAALSR